MLLLAPPQSVKNAGPDEVKLGFSSIFWNTAWTHRQAPTTLGILCDPKHPAFAEFATDFHSKWQWWYLVTRAAPMILDNLPAGFQPTVQVIDDWFTARRLGWFSRLAWGEEDWSCAASGSTTPIRSRANSAAACCVTWPATGFNRCRI